MKLDKLTMDYRKAEFKAIAFKHSAYNPKIKIISPNGETKWMDISVNELDAIREVLTTGKHT